MYAVGAVEKFWGYGTTSAPPTPVSVRLRPTGSSFRQAECGRRRGSSRLNAIEESEQLRRLSICLGGAPTRWPAASRRGSHDFSGYRRQLGVADDPEVKQTMEALFRNTADRVRLRHRSKLIRPREEASARRNSENDLYCSPYEELCRGQGRSPLEVPALNDGSVAALERRFDLRSSL